MTDSISKNLNKLSRAYDFLFRQWESAWSQRWQANLLVAVFLAALFVIELARQNFLPESLHIPTNHFHSVKLVFELLLTLEILGLVFNLAGSVANAMGKQFEIFSLILLRQSFKEFVHFEEPLRWEQVSASVPFMISDALGALVIFGLLGVFYAVQKHRKITENSAEQANFVIAKKILALFLLAAFVIVGVNDARLWFSANQTYNFFDVFYTILIFSDILIVIISLRYNSTYSVVFRNSGFAVATVILRLALAAPPFANVVLGISAIFLCIGLTFVYNKFSLLPTHSETTTTELN